MIKVVRVVMAWTLTAFLLLLSRPVDAGRNVVRSLGPAGEILLVLAVMSYRKDRKDGEEA